MTQAGPLVPRDPSLPPAASLQRSILLTVLVTLVAVLVLMVLGTAA